MTHIINEESIKQYTNPSRYPDAVVPNLQLWIKKPGQMYWIYRFKTPIFAITEAQIANTNHNKT